MSDETTQAIFGDAVADSLEKPGRKARWRAGAGSLGKHLSSPRDNNFNLIRLIAATAVVWGHSFAISSNAAGTHEGIKDLIGFTYSGLVAVDVFFLISGIFVTQSFYADRQALGFLAKRLLRIGPALVVCTGLTAAAALVLSSEGTRLLTDRLEYLYVLRNSTLHLQWSLPGLFEGRPQGAANGSLWTLSIEASMYVVVLVAGLAGLVRSRGALVAATAVLFAACLIWPSLIDPYIPIGRSVVLVPVLFFLAGMAIFACRDLVRPGLAAVVLPAGAACFASGHAFVVLAYLAIGALTLWVGCTPLLTSMSERLRGEDYSYGVYLYGFPVAQGFAALWPRANPYELFLVSMTVILPCAIASWRIVEHPAQRLGKIIDRWLSERPLDIGALGRAGRGMWRGVAIPCAVLLVAAFGLGTIETLAAIRPSRLLDVSIVSYGPVSIRAGASFNLQKDGSSALWLVLGRPPESGMIVLANGNPLPTYVGNVLAATMPPALFAKPGRVEIRVEEIRDATRLQSPPVFIDVR